MSSAYYVCCIYSNALQKPFTMEANITYPDQTAPKEAVRSGSTFFQIKAIEKRKQMREQMTTVVNGMQKCVQMKE